MRHHVDHRGRHVFSNGAGGVATFDVDLEERHMTFLCRNPAAVRVCALVGVVTTPWLDRLMADVALIDASGLGRLH